MTNFIFFASIAVCILATACTGISIFGEGEVIRSQLKIISIEQEGETTLINLDVVQGSKPLNFVGISYSKEAEVSILDNQSIYDIEGSGIYEIALEGLEPERMHHFLAFLGQEFALEQSEVDSFFVPRPLPPDIPCSLTLNVIEDRGITFNTPTSRADGGYGGLGAYGISISTGLFGPRISVNFASVPTNGVYTTATYSSLESNPLNAYIYYRADGVLGATSIDPGQAVFVEKIEEDHYLISFCDVPYSLPDISGTWSFSGQVEVK